MSDMKHRLETTVRAWAKRQRNIHAEGIALLRLDAA